MRHGSATPLIFLLAISLVLQATPIAHADDHHEASQEWKSAEKKWAEFSQDYLGKMREKKVQHESVEGEYKTSSGGFVEIKSGLIRKYMPAYRFFTDRRQIFALHIAGEIISLGGGSWTSADNSPRFTNSVYSSFLARLRIHISDAQSAIEVIKVTEDISRAPSLLSTIKDATNEFHAFDWRALGRVLPNDDQWSYAASRNVDVWSVSESYIGSPGVSVFLQPTWELVTDDEGYVREASQRREPL